jgi:hypothetical protein
MRPCSYFTVVKKLACMVTYRVVTFQYANMTFRQLRQFINVTIHQLTICQHDNSPTWHFANLQFAMWQFAMWQFAMWQFTNWQFANMTICQYDILTRWQFAKLQFTNMTIRQHDISPTCHLTELRWVCWLDEHSVADPDPGSGAF